MRRRFEARQPQRRSTHYAGRLPRRFGYDQTDDYGGPEPTWWGTAFLFVVVLLIGLGFWFLLIN